MTTLTTVLGLPPSLGLGEAGETNTSSSVCYVWAFGVYYNNTIAVPVMYSIFDDMHGWFGPKPVPI